MGLKLPITLQLAAYALLVALLIAIPTGVYAAVRRNSVWDYLASGVSLGGVSIPNFWLGIMLILFFSVRLGWLPASGYVPLGQDPWGNTRRMIMPAFVLGTALAAVLMRQTRNSMIEVLSADYIRTAYSKGLARPAVVFRHARFIAGTSQLGLTPIGSNRLLTWIDERHGNGITDPAPEVWIDLAWY